MSRLQTSQDPYPAVCPYAQQHSPELSVQMGEQLVATGDRHRFSNEKRSGIGIPVAQAQSQESAEVGVEATWRAVTDTTESNTQ